MIQHMGVTESNGAPFLYRCPGFGASWTASFLMEGSLRKQFATGEECVITAPSLSVYDSDSRHIFSSQPPAHHLRSIWLIFTAPILNPDGVFPDRDAPGAWSIQLQDKAIAEQLRLLFREMLEHWRSRRLYSRQLADNALERVFLLLANETAREGVWLDPRVRKALDFMHANMHRKLTVASIARVVNLSVSRFSHLFAEMTECTPVEYLEHIRIEEAKNMLLMQPVSVMEIAARLGFDNQFYFSNRFRKRCGVSPMQFRKQHGTA